MEVGVIGSTEGFGPSSPSSNLGPPIPAAVMNWYNKLT